MKAQKSAGGKLLLAIEVILIILGLVCSTCSLVKEITASDNAPEITGEAPDMTGETPPDATGEAPDMTGETPPDMTGETPPDMTGEAPDMSGEEPPEGQPMANLPQTMLNVGSAAVRYAFMALPIVMYLLAGVYSFISYKKPHGNTLRVAMLVFGLYLVIEGVSNELFTCTYILPVAGALVAYMSGRLNKEKKNRIVAVIVAALLLGFGILEIVNKTEFSFIGVYSQIGNFILWLILVYAYFARFNEHVQAGVESDNAVTEEKILSE